MVIEHSDGLIPSLDQASDELLSELGEVGHAIAEMRSFRNLVRQNGDDYEALSSRIGLSKLDTPIQTQTSWSKISDQVYARFVTQGHFQEAGQLEIRVLPSPRNRIPNSFQTQKVLIDINSWVADPQNVSVQPLTFSAIVGSRGILLFPEFTPLIAVSALGFILSAEYIDWESFFKLSHLLKNEADSRVRKLIDDGTIILKEEHDELEKPAKDAGVIDKKTKKYEESKNNDARQYEKPGGIKALQEDFDKFPGKVKKAQDGTELKKLPDGKTVVMRLTPTDDSPPTLEIQPQRVGNKVQDRLRVKVRYR